MLTFVVELIDLNCKDSPKKIIYICNDVIPNGILLLEGKDGKVCREHSKNCAPYHLLINNPIHHELKKEVATMILCDECQCRWHMAYLRPLLLILSLGDWICPYYRN
uniref:Uncharacterized protein n=1 Tax=Physcomitrium patens TaxID=3218 RepID=A0A2K1I9S3_PHYPA|nr:hypothetical protein PHYPA_031213 [Physcomitrium patens]